MALAHYLVSWLEGVSGVPGATETVNCIKLRKAAGLGLPARFKNQCPFHVPQPASQKAACALLRTYTGLASQVQVLDHTPALAKFQPDGVIAVKTSKADAWFPACILFRHTADKHQPGHCGQSSPRHALHGQRWSFGLLIPRHRNNKYSWLPPDTPVNPFMRIGLVHCNNSDTRRGRTLNMQRTHRPCLAIDQTTWAVLILRITLNDFALDNRLLNFSITDDTLKHPLDSVVCKPQLILASAVFYQFQVDFYRHLTPVILEAHFRSER